MRRRRAAAEETRQRILDAAHELLERPDGGRLALEDIADRAGVTRATIYNRIGGRAELLAAVFTDQGRLVEFDRVLAALEIDDPVKATIRTVRESCRSWSLRPDAIRRTLALASVDSEVHVLVERYERSRRARLGVLANRLFGSGETSADRRHVADTLAITTSFQAYDLLRLDHAHHAATRRLLAMTRSALGI